jgi:hypothetical protein
VPPYVLSGPGFFQGRSKKSWPMPIRTAFEGAVECVAATVRLAETFDTSHPSPTRFLDASDALKRLAEVWLENSRAVAVVEDELVRGRGGRGPYSAGGGRLPDAHTAHHAAVQAAWQVLLAVSAETSCLSLLPSAEEGRAIRAEDYPTLQQELRDRAHVLRDWLSNALPESILTGGLMGELRFEAVAAAASLRTVPPPPLPYFVYTVTQEMADSWQVRQPLASAQLGDEPLPLPEREEDPCWSEDELLTPLQRRLIEHMTGLSSDALESESLA